MAEDSMKLKSTSEYKFALIEAEAADDVAPRGDNWIQEAADRIRGMYGIFSDAFARTGEHIYRRRPFPGLRPLSWKQIQDLFEKRTRDGLPVLIGEPDPAKQIHQRWPEGAVALLMKGKEDGSE